jgi:hypothetical protein
VTKFWHQGFSKINFFVKDFNKRDAELWSVQMFPRFNKSFLSMHIEAIQAQFCCMVLVFVVVLDLAKHFSCFSHSNTICFPPLCDRPFKKKADNLGP